MKRACLTLAAMAAAKIGTIEYLQRAATRDVIVTAYASQAVSACQKATRVDILKPGPSWGTPAGVRVEIGNRQTPVALWQVDHQDWQARFRRTYLVLDAAGARCHFDVNLGTATVAAL